ncbi:MAG: PQQ-dependent sugar dehydrogenase [Desulfurivibrionaceae bacterium]
MKKSGPGIIFLSAFIVILLVYALSQLTTNSSESASNNKIGDSAENTGRKLNRSALETSSYGEEVISAQETPEGRIRTLDNGMVLGGRPVMPPQYRITEPTAAEVETVVRNLEIPWDLEFTRDGEKLYFTERPGRVRFVRLNREEPTVHLWLDRENSTLHWGEGGLMGLALHPDFGTGKKDEQGKSLNWIYLSETYGSTENPGNRILRVRKLPGDNGSKLEREILIDNIPAASYHNGSSLAFARDGMLYATTGDAGNPDLAQDLNSWAGKILRLTPDGKPAPDNPFSGDGPRSYVYSFGHRNPQGLAWHPETGDLYASEHGPSGEFGLGGNDEINLIRKGRNYGWPKVVGAPGLKDYEDPLLHFPDPHLPPAGMAFYTGDRGKRWKGSLFVGSLRGELLLRAEIDSTGSGPSVTRIDRFFEVKHFDGAYGRIRAVATGPDGCLYFTTSNRDGRGIPADNDDRIMRIVPDR